MFAMFNNNPTIEEERMSALDELLKAAKIYGAEFHPANSADAYFCECGVFGKGDKACWSCGSLNIHWQYLPKMVDGTPCNQAT